MPVGAFGGKREVMEVVAPLGGVYQAGTLSGNPIAMQAGLTTLELIDEPGFYERLEEQSAKLIDGLQLLADAAGSLSRPIGSAACLASSSLTQRL